MTAIMMRAAMQSKSGRVCTHVLHQEPGVHACATKNIDASDDDE